jgi:hypothetical protein
MNWYDIQQLENARNRLTKLGYQMRQSKYGNSGDYKIGIYPLDKELPLYSRDAELFCGDLNSILAWLAGIEQRNMYLTMLKAYTDERVKKLEEKYIKSRIHKAMVDKIKNPDKKIDKHTQDLMET